MYRTLRIDRGYGSDHVDDEACEQLPCALQTLARPVALPPEINRSFNSPHASSSSSQGAISTQLGGHSSLTTDLI